MKAMRLLIVIVNLTLIGFATPVWTQDKEQAEKLYKEAQTAEHNVRTWDQVEPKLVQALEIFERLGDKKRVADVNLSLAKKYEAKYKLDPAKVIPVYEKSLALYKDVNDPKGEAETLKALASFTYRSNHQYGAKDYSKVEAYTEKALAACRKVKDRAGEAWSLSWLGSLDRRAGRYDKAVEHYEASAAIGRELGDKEKQVAPLTYLGSTYRDWGQYEKAVESYERLLALCRELKSGSIECEADALQGIGMTYGKWGNREKEQEYFQRFLKIRDEMMGRKPEAR